VHGGALDDPRVDIVIGDAADFVARQNAGLEPCAPAGATERRGGQPTRLFDAVVFDLTPPDSPASALYAPAFYRQLRRLMAPGATLSMHLGAALFEPKRIAALTSDLRAAFRFVSMLSAFVPLYGTQWRIAIASDVHDVARAAPALLATRAAERGIRDLRYYRPEAHDALFRIAALEAP
jgi:spermidine synthase